MAKYLESDRYDYSNQLAKHPSTGIIFTETTEGHSSRGKLNNYRNMESGIQLYVV
jgi:hypothetical protein